MNSWWNHAEIVRVSTNLKIYKNRLISSNFIDYLKMTHLIWFWLELCIFLLKLLKSVFCLYDSINISASKITPLTVSSNLLAFSWDLAFGIAKILVTLKSLHEALSPFVLVCCSLWFTFVWSFGIIASLW